MKRYSLKLVWIFLIAGFISSCGDEDSSIVTDRPDSVIDTDLNYDYAPERFLTQQWNGQEQPLYREYFDSNVGIYYDENVDREITWTRSFTSQVWGYARDRYELGSNLVYAVFHSTEVTPFVGNIYDESTTNKYLFDITLHEGDASDSDKDLIIEMISEIVQKSAFGVNTSPASDLWQAKWKEIFMYDVYTVLNMDEDAQRIKDTYLDLAVTYPSADTYWFKNWFLSIYETYEGGITLGKFFETVSINFPLDDLGISYDHQLNMGEFVHFFSAATGDDIQALAETAFGWNDEWNTELLQARSDFPNVDYPFEPTSEIVDLTGFATITVSDENPGGPTAGEGSQKLIDDNIGTKFLIFNYHTGFWVQQNFTDGQVVNRYTITSANDASGRDPKTWTLEGSNDGIGWTQLDSRSNQVFGSRYQTNEYIIDNDVAYKYYRMNITENNGDGLFQCAEWRLKVLRLIQQ
nr:discoidin domain-containing protein [uncultured Carboxylicivirga sp.]